METRLIRFRLAAKRVTEGIRIILMPEENAQIKLKKEQLMVIAVITECREEDVHLITLLPVFVLQGGFMRI